MIVDYKVWVNYVKGKTVSSFDYSVIQLVLVSEGVFSFFLDGKYMYPGEVLASEWVGNVSPGLHKPDPVR